MPVVRMRRTSGRMFGARVLRSGRRVMMSSPRETMGKEWIKLLEGSGDSVLKLEKNNYNQDCAKLNHQDMDFGNEKKWGVVYSRKRKRLGYCEDRKFGKRYFRKKNFERSFLCVLVGSLSASGNCLLSGFLESVFRYMARAKLGLSQLSAFAISESFSRVYASRGVRFLRDTSLNKRSGVCKIFGATGFLPSFSVDFSALPSCFIYFHSSLFLRSTCSPHFLILSPTNPTEDEIIEDENMDVDIEMVEDILQEPCISTCSESYFPENQIIPSVNINHGKKSSLKISVGAPRVTGRSVQFKSNIITRGIQKRRSSLRSKKSKSTSFLRGRMGSSAFISSLLSFKHNSFLLADSVKNNNTAIKSSLVELNKDVGSASCYANILVVESTKCYRIVRAVVKLEKNVSRKWSLAVKKDGKILYFLNTHNIMRPCSSNRVTHDIIWRDANNTWKLEFPDRGDWLIFKELYKECSERNMRALPANIIPVPGVQEVSDYAETNIANFIRPNLYISVKEGELSRALAKKTPNYDLDSEDEEWLKKFHERTYLKIDHSNHVSEDTFEMIIDALEKGIFRNPDNFSEEAAVDLCLHLAKKEVVEAIYSYWMRKRKQKRSALVQVFQFYQPRRTQLLTKPFIRKKRSFKRQPSRPERAKQRTFIPIVVPKPDPVEEQKALLKVEEAKAATARSVDAAIDKRKKAQILMEIADVATYKAAMALRIAEAAQIAESFDVSDSFLLE